MGMGTGTRRVCEKRQRVKEQ
ncbi:uncharacterized protein G2W53_043993 [Senna tora]|uniref:Uncharacterized protein n=1 Tax=Senna tora TaxID=362788 RepID=A0A834SJQ2_9FABA|nr:uncharacterized protein G2W53_043993 [Senna tora]